MEKKKYLAPEIKMTEFEKEEVLTVSGTDMELDPLDSGE